MKSALFTFKYMGPYKETFVNMASASMKSALFTFKYTRDVQVLRDCEFTAGLAYLMEYYRGRRILEDLQAACFYAKRMEILLGMTLPNGDYWHPLKSMNGESDGHTFEMNGYEEQALIDQVLQKIDAVRRATDVVDGPSPVLITFHKQALSGYHPVPRKHSS